MRVLSLLCISGTPGHVNITSLSVSVVRCLRPWLLEHHVISLGNGVTYGYTEGSVGAVFPSLFTWQPSGIGWGGKGTGRKSPGFPARRRRAESIVERYTHALDNNIDSHMISDVMMRMGNLICVAVTFYMGE